MMTHEEKITWMALWAAKNGVILALEGECGFGRECVGILAGNSYPDYEWNVDDDSWERADKNGDVWTPENAYHKHPCVAVLGRGEEAEAQLYEWLKWFDDNNFKVETGVVERDIPFNYIELLLGKNEYSRMVKQERDDASY